MRQHDLDTALLQLHIVVLLGESHDGRCCAGAQLLLQLLSCIAVQGSASTWKVACIRKHTVCSSTPSEHVSSVADREAWTAELHHVSGGCWQ